MWGCALEKFLIARKRASVLAVLGVSVCLAASAQAPEKTAAAAAPYTGTADDFVQIHQLFDQYVYGLQMGDDAAYADTFTPDGVFQTPERCQLNVGSRPGARKGHKPVPDQNVPRVRQPNQQARYESFPISAIGPINYIDKDHATAHSVAFRISEQGPNRQVGLVRIGTYDDKLVRVDGKWKIAYRFAQYRMPEGFKPVPCAPQEKNGFKFYMFRWD